MPTATVCAIQGFEGGDLLIDDGASLPLKVVSTVSRSGGFSGQSTVAGKETGVIEFWSPTTILALGNEGISYSLPFRMDTQATAGGFPFRCSLASLSTGLIPEVAIDEDKTICIVTGPNPGGNYGTVHWKGSHVMSLSTFYVLHVQQYKAGGAGASSNWPIRVKLYSNNGATLHDDSGWRAPIYLSAAAATTNSLTVGQYSLPSTGGLFYYDDIVVVYGGAGAPIAPLVTALRPSGNSATDNQWVSAGAGSDGIKYHDVDEAPPDGDNTYIEPNSAGGTNQQQLFTHPSLGLTTEPVYGVLHRMMVRRALGVPSMQLLMKNSAGNVLLGPTHIAGTTYGYDSRRMLAREPGAIGSGLTYEWTAAKVDACEFGIRQATSGAGARTRMTQQWVEVAHSGIPWTDDYPGRFEWNDSVAGPGRPNLIHP